MLLCRRCRCSAEDACDKKRSSEARGPGCPRRPAETQLVWDRKGPSSGRQKIGSSRGVAALDENSLDDNLWRPLSRDSCGLPNESRPRRRATETLDIGAPEHRREHGLAKVRVMIWGRSVREVLGAPRRRCPHRRVVVCSLPRARLRGQSVRLSKRTRAFALFPAPAEHHQHEDACGPGGQGRQSRHLDACHEVLPELPGRLRMTTSPYC